MRVQISRVRVPGGYNARVAIERAIHHDVAVEDVSRLVLEAHEPHGEMWRVFAQVTTNESPAGLVYDHLFEEHVAFCRGHLDGIRS